MTPLFDDAPAVEHNDFCRVANAARAVRGDNRCSACERNPELAQNNRFRVCVHGAQSVIEKHDRRLAARVPAQATPAASGLPRD